MTTLSPQTQSRVLRGIALYNDRAGEIKHVGPSLYEVPGSNGQSYRVDYRDGRCGCPDHARHPEYTCKHITAVTLYAAKESTRAAEVA